MIAEPAQPWFAPDIDHVPGVQGGEAVLRGTRTPVRSVVSLAEEVGQDVARLRRELPHLSERQVRAALAYYAAHREEIDAARNAHAAAYDASAAPPWRG